MSRLNGIFDIVMKNNNIRAKRFFQYFAQTNRCHNGNGYLIRNYNLVFCHNVNYLEILPVNRKYWLKHSRNFQISDSTWIPDIKIGWTKWYTQHFNDDTLQSGCYFDTYSSILWFFLKNLCTVGALCLLMIGLIG